MATGVKKKPTKGGLYQGYFTDYTAKKRYFTTLTRSEAKREAKRLEAEHRLIRQGIRPVPSSAGRHRSTLFTEAVRRVSGLGKVARRTQGPTVESQPRRQPGEATGVVAGKPGN